MLVRRFDHLPVLNPKGADDSRVVHPPIRDALGLPQYAKVRDAVKKINELLDALCPDPTAHSESKTHGARVGRPLREAMNATDRALDLADQTLSELRQRDVDADTWRNAYDTVAGAAGALDGEPLQRTVARIAEMRDRSLAQVTTSAPATASKAMRGEHAAAALDAAAQIATLASQRAKDRGISVAQATREVVDAREDLAEPYLSARDRAGHR